MVTSHSFVSLAINPSPPGSPARSSNDNSPPPTTPRSEASNIPSPVSPLTSEHIVGSSREILELNDEKEYHIVRTDEQAKEKTKINIDSAKTLIDQQDFSAAIDLIEAALEIYSKIEDQTSVAYWKTFAEYRELHAKAYQLNHKTFLDHGVQLVYSRHDDKDYNEKQFQQFESLQQELKIATEGLLARDKLIENLRTEIQRLENRLSPGILECIANSVVNAFTAIKQCNLHWQMIESMSHSIHSFWSNLNEEPASKPHAGSSQEMQHLKKHG